MGDSEKQLDTVNTADGDSTVEIHLYKRRWFMLFMFSMISLSNAALFTTVGAINSIASKYYDVDPDTVNWVGNSFILIYILTALPSAYFMTRVGLRVSVIIAASINSVAGCLHFAGCFRNGFPLVIAGQMIGAFAVGYILNVPPKLAAEWFSNSEQSKATSIGTFANIGGAAVGFLQPTHMVPDSSDMKEVGQGIFQLYLSQLVFMIVILILVYFFFESKPLLPPTYSVVSKNVSGIEKTAFLKTLKILVKSKDFQFHLHGFGLYFGIYVLTLICMNQLLKDSLSETNIGGVGFTFETCGMFGIAISGIINDKFKCYRSLSILIVLGALLSWVGITALLLFTKYELAYFIVFGVAGVFFLAFMSHSIVQVAEMTYPIPESTTGAVMFNVANMYAFIFILVLGPLVDQGNIKLVLYIGIAIYFLSFFLVVLTKVELKRQKVENANIKPTKV